jgi:hypothetical protein
MQRRTSRRSVSAVSDVRRCCTQPIGIAGYVLVNSAQWVAWLRIRDAGVVELLAEGTAERGDASSDVSDERCVATDVPAPWTERTIMHATLRRLKCAPGKTGEVAKLIETEYVPQLAYVAGVVSYTLVRLGEDEVVSLGVFTNQVGATEANTLAQTWAKDRLAGLGAAPLEAGEGEVLTHFTFPS